MSYTPPKDIIEARIRMLQGEKFVLEGFDRIIGYDINYDEFKTWGLLTYCQNWLPYKEPEPEFPFQFDELVCVRDGHGTEWRAARYSHLSKIPEATMFRCLGDSLFEEITTFSHDLLGKVCEPTTLVWIVREGEPCIKQ